MCLRADHGRTTLRRMSDPLFPDVDPRPAGDGRDDAPPRYETANRDQIELQPCDLETLLPPGHAARLVWRFVEGLDLSAFYAAIRAREGRAGRPPIDPKILVALWLYATMDGVGSAREVDRLCYSHDAYRWLRGGVSVNYHTLSDFRVRASGGARRSADAVDRRAAASRRRDDGARRARWHPRARQCRGGLVSPRRDAAGVPAAGAEASRAHGRNRPTRRSMRARRRRSSAPRAERLARVEEALAQLPAVQATKERQQGQAADARRASRRPIPMRA